VKGFSIIGRVVNTKNEGIEGVNVTMSKTLKSVLTDHNGLSFFSFSLSLSLFNHHQLRTFFLNNDMIDSCFGNLTNELMIV
jgi:hypothetical protein